MRLAICAAAALSFAVAGCSKKKTATPPPTTVAKPAPTPEAVKPLPPPAQEETLGVVFFAFDRSDLSEEAKGILREAAKRFDAPIQVRIEGHADERGSTEYNLALSEQRAAAVMRYLSDLGVPSARLSTVAYGEEKPADREAHEKNRRAELRVIPTRVSQN